MYEKSPVQYLDELYDKEDDFGYTTEGWYFWDETWSFCYGPYLTFDKANQKCNEYNTELMEHHD